MALQIVLFLFQTQLRIWWSSDGCDGHVELVSEGNTYKQQTQWNQGLMGKCSFKQQLPCLGKVDKVSARVGVYLQPHVFCLEEKWDLNVLRFIHYFEINFKKSNFFYFKAFWFEKSFFTTRFFSIAWGQLSHLCAVYTCQGETVQDSKTCHNLQQRHICTHPLTWRHWCSGANWRAAFS